MLEQLTLQTNILMIVLTGLILVFIGLQIEKKEKHVEQYKDSLIDKIFYNFFFFLICVFWLPTLLMIISALIVFSMEYLYKCLFNAQDH